MKACYVVCLVALFQLGCNAQKPPAVPPPPTTLSPGDSSNLAPANDSPALEQPADSDAVTVQIKDFDGLQELIASKRGKVVVMDCWSTWCAPCVKEFPGLVKLHHQYGPERVACISLSFNYGGGKNETPEEHEDDVLKFLRGQNATFDNVIAGVPSDELYPLLGFKSAAIPAIFVYDREGKIIEQFEGADAQYSEVEKLVAQLVEQP